MKYTIDSPGQSKEVFLNPISGKSSPLKKVAVGKLLPLPNASRKTSNMFIDYGEQAWEGQPPQFCVMSFQPGSPVLQWKGKALNIISRKQLDKLTVGILKSSSVMGEIASVNSIMYIEQTKVLT
jgi:hypothetical protein